MMSSNMAEWTLKPCPFKSYPTCLNSCTCLMVRSPCFYYDMCTFDSMIITYVCVCLCMFVLTGTNLTVFSTTLPEKSKRRRSLAHWASGIWTTNVAPNPTRTRCTTSCIKTSMANEGKWLSWAPVGERSPSFASSILRPLMPLGSQTNYIKLRVAMRGYAWSGRFDDESNSEFHLFHVWFVVSSSFVSFLGSLLPFSFCFFNCPFRSTFLFPFLSFLDHQNVPI